MAEALRTVQEIYAAFGRGDVATILSVLAEDVQWENWENNSAQRAGVPWLRGGAGKSAALDFFGVVATMQITDFRVIGMMANENQVAVEVVLDAVLANGKRIRDEEMHLWTIDGDGKVSRMRHYVDTAKHMAVAAA